jgi:hypothetical protein
MTVPPAPAVATSVVPSKVNPPPIVTALTVPLPLAFSIPVIVPAPP